MGFAGVWVHARVVEYYLGGAWGLSVGEGMECECVLVEG